ncbi:type II toxin-antitoxin system HicB family antitoxin [Janthinobacterium sp. TND4EL3]|uniref:type II toxin-antitoxin system HicB family antitoxin n=1 Tax=Janthinobacterium sp. TND4EL3 TaxID=1907311 RepID=UPI000970CD20|nr:type II toxin-antitoxin system HicB family antitoxin [Janthinobacterium sp. TND4EL3]
MSDKALSYNGYCGSIEVSIEDNCLHGKVMFINDLITYEASNPSELEAEFRKAIDYYLEKCASENVIPDKQFSGSFNVRISPDLHKAASIKAIAKGTSLNDLMRECITEFLSESRTVLTINQNHEHHHYPDDTQAATTAPYEEDSRSSWTQVPPSREKKRPQEKRATH